MSEIKGSCLCGKVSYEVVKLEPKMGHCHCSMCRKFHGAAFATFGEAKSENFSWLTGEDALVSYTADNGTVRQFCKHCGASLTFSVAAELHDVVEFTLGTLDSDIANRPDVHIYVESKACWYEIEGVLPQFSEGRE